MRIGWFLKDFLVTDVAAVGWLKFSYLLPCEIKILALYDVRVRKTYS